MRILIGIIGIIFLTLLQGCSTTATRSDGETLSIRGIGKAKWADGTEIEGKTIWPELPNIKYD